MYAKPAFLHTSPSKSPDMYAKPGFLHTKRQPLHAQGLASDDSNGQAKSRGSLATASSHPSRR